MDLEKIEEIFNNADPDWDGDNAYLGLQILSKYTDKVVQGADHDIIYSEDVDILIEKNITEDDVKKLAKLNWFIYDEYLACYV